MINGFQNEQIFISNINGRPYKIQNLLLQDLLKELFPKIKDEDIVYAYKYGKYAKTDMVLEVNGKRKGIWGKIQRIARKRKLEKLVKCD